MVDSHLMEYMAKQGGVTKKYQMSKYVRPHWSIDMPTRTLMAVPHLELVDSVTGHHVS